VKLGAELDEAATGSLAIQKLLPGARAELAHERPSPVSDYRVLISRQKTVISANPKL
jgi:hypothetical protein